MFAGVAREKYREMKVFLLAYSEPKSYNISAMGKYRKWINKLAVGLAFLAFVCLGSFLWVRNENAYDAKMESQLIWEYIRHYEETHDPDTIFYPYIGSTKTKTFHTFESKCAREIRSTQLRGFDSKEDAEKGGYNWCTVCKP